ncbi:hypothetical protein [Marinobacter sp.]|uniref:hypothetical protein n=1 Tax=Marinobacter sp. TaxID=50741 RepID=UPI003A928F94
MASTEVTEHYDLHQKEGDHIGRAKICFKTTRVPECNYWSFDGKVVVYGPTGNALGWIKGEVRAGKVCFVDDLILPFHLEGMGVATWLLDRLRDLIPEEVGLTPWLKGTLTPIDSKTADRGYGKRRNDFWKKHLVLGSTPGAYYTPDSDGHDGSFLAPWRQYVFDPEKAGFTYQKISLGVPG